MVCLLVISVDYVPLIPLCVTTGYVKEFPIPISNFQFWKVVDKDCITQPRIKSPPPLRATFEQPVTSFNTRADSHRLEFNYYLSISLSCTSESLALTLSTQCYLLIAVWSKH